MIVLFHLLYCTFREIYTTLKLKIKNKHEKAITSNLFLEYEVNSSGPKKDLEFIVKFDPPVYIQRYSAVHEILVNEQWRGQIKKVVDFGCAEFGFFIYIKRVLGLQEILFVDVDKALLEYNVTRIYPLTSDYLCQRKEPLNIQVLYGSVAYPSPQLIDVDAVICIEIIEHLYPDTLDALPYNIFGFIKPRIVVFTTPNADFNSLFPNFSGFRHSDHKFEWTREQFQDWAENISIRYPDYLLSFQGIGYGPKGTEKLGTCSQMAVFVKKTRTELKPYEEDNWRTSFCKEVSSKNNLKKYTDENISYYTDFSNNCIFCKFEKLNNFDFCSYGVCTYESCSVNCIQSFDASDQINSSSLCDHTKFYYTEINRVEYPYEIDTRTQEEIILHSAVYLIHRHGSWTGRYFNDVKNYAEVPLYVLTTSQDGFYITVPDLENILKNAGWQIEECNVEGFLTPCVIYDPNTGMSNSSNRTISESNSVRFSSTNSDWPEDNDSQWDNSSAPEDSVSNLECRSLAINSYDLFDNGSKFNSNMQGETSTSKQLEFLFDSTCQATSSTELIPDSLPFDATTEKIPDEPETIVFRTESEGLPLKSSLKKQKVTKPSNIPVAMKSDGSIVKKRNAMKEHKVEPLAPDNPEVIIENGDLANNNRDREGNNYQAAENVARQQNENDNAGARVVNLDDDNENNILNLNAEDPDNEIEGENLEGVSREVLFDPNSENSLPEVEMISGEQRRNRSMFIPLLVSRVPHNPSEESINRDPNLFPNWLLHLLNAEEGEEDSLESLSTDAHFYSQGDGLGIHPSVIDISSDSSGSDTTTHHSSTTIVMQGTAMTLNVPMPSTSANDTLNEDYYSFQDDDNTNTEQSESNLDVQSSLVGIEQVLFDLEEQSSSQNKDSTDNDTQNKDPQSKDPQNQGS